MNLNGRFGSDGSKHRSAGFCFAAGWSKNHSKMRSLKIMRSSLKRTRRSNFGKNFVMVSMRSFGFSGRIGARRNSFIIGSTGLSISSTLLMRHSVLRRVLNHIFHRFIDPIPQQQCWQ